jgi:hypothetical protein
VTRGIAPGDLRLDSFASLNQKRSVVDGLKA